jgi:hydroxymethylpyrimidine/phosphomethylpyrimidine kinase
MFNITPRILVVAGSDSGGGAGIQADIKTITMLGGHAMTAITAITAQNTLGVEGVMHVPTEMVVAQIEACISDIGVDAIKIGMLSSADTVNAVADLIAGLDVPIVFDPVMIATSGDVLASESTIAAFARLMKIATLTTPNIPELKYLSGLSTIDIDAVEAAGKALAERIGQAVLVKGGHARGDEIVDLLIQPSARDEAPVRWTDQRIESTSTHGTGCTLASAIACGLASRWDLADAIARARLFVRLAILDAPRLGKGHGPMGQQAVRLDVPLDPVTPTLNQIVLPTHNLELSEVFYQRLGFRQIVRLDPGYARFENKSGMTLSVEIAEELGFAPVLCIECDDLDERVEMMTRHGVEVSPAEDKDWGWREARFADPAGNPICLYQAGEKRRFPSWRLK